MMKRKEMKTVIKRFKPGAIGVLGLALLPMWSVRAETISEILGQIAPSEGGKLKVEDSIIGTAKDGISGTGQLFLLAVSLIAFLWVAYAAIAKFRECQAGRADWGELLVLGLAAGALLVFVAVLLTQAAGILGSLEE